MNRSAGSTLLTRITLARIVLVPVVMALVLVGHRVDNAYVLAAVLFAVAATTDFVDGYLARRWAAASSLGSFLDTTADKLLVAGTLIALVAVDRASPWIAVIIIGREFLIMALRGFIATGGTLMKPSIWGKWKAVVQFVAITLSIVHPAVLVGPMSIDEWLMIIAAVVTIISGVEYLVRFAPAFSEDRISTRRPGEG